MPSVGVEGSTPTEGTCLNDFFRSNRPGYPHPVSSELENSGIRVAVGDCSVNERRRWRPLYQNGKTVHVHAKHYKHNEDGRTAPGVCGNGSVPLSHSGNVVTRIRIHTHEAALKTLPHLDLQCLQIQLNVFMFWLFKCQVRPRSAVCSSF